MVNENSIAFDSMRYGKRNPFFTALSSPLVHGDFNAE
jgi:hypothetical protein